MQKLFTMLLLLSTVCLTLNGLAAQNLAATSTPLSEVEQLQLPRLDNKELLQAEQARRAPGRAPRFAETIEVNVSPNTHGTWEVANGTAVWRLRVPSPGAKSINFGFDQYRMPPGGQLMLYTPDGSLVQGPFTPADNEDHEELWTPVIPGDELVIEVSLPAARQSELRLHLKSVNHDFLGFGDIASSVLSGSCNLDVVCGAADGWGIVDNYRDIIQSVGVISTGGGTFCTGFLVSNARQDCAPFFMTANHCGINNGNAPSLVVYWNYINSVCRQPGSPASGGNGDGSLADFNTGSIFRAAYAPSDMTLVELDDPVSETADAWFAGWDAREVLAQDTIIGIHHPSTDEKRISFEFDGVYTGNWGSGATPVPDGNHLIIEDWDIGTTEGGSSGSPIFNSNKQVIGQLHGGAASCNNDSYDSYGWFFTSWEGGGTPSTRLRDWLDPDNTGVLEIPGRAQLQCSFFAGATPAVQTLCAPSTATYDISVNENFFGPVNLTLVNLPIGLTAVFDETIVNPGEGTQMTITGTENLPEGVYSFVLNGTDGTNVSNQTLTLTILSGTPAATTLLSPIDMAVDQFTGLLLTWMGQPLVESYDVEIATDPNFTNIIGSGMNLTETSFLTPNLDILTDYYWRVRSANICGDGAWSAAFQFTTAAVSCAINTAATEGITIGPNNGTITTSTLMIAQTGEILDLRLTNLSSNHTWMGDLNATLTSPSGTVINLFNRPSCNQQGILASFADDATATAADFVGTCNGGGIAIQGEFQPAQPFSTFVGEEASGLWTLTIVDNANQDGGDLLGWNLEICTLVTSEIALTPSTDELGTCVGDFAVVDLTIGNGFEGPVSLSASNLPNGAVVDFEANPAMPGSTITVTFSSLTTDGNFNIILDGTDGTNESTQGLSLTVLAGAPAGATLLSPTDMAVDELTSVLLTWVPEPLGVDYDVEIATDPAFTNIVGMGMNLTETSFQTPELEIQTNYYWRVRATNICGEGAWSAAFQFTTIAITCAINTASTEGVTIGPANGTITTSTLMVNQMGAIQEVSLSNLSSNHTYMGDLNATLTSPTGTVITLFNRPNCNQGGILANFSDDATDTAADFQATCNGGGIAIQGDFQPAQPFSTFVGEEANGLWTLTIVDNADADAGNLFGWNLDICTLAPSEVILVPSTNVVSACNGGFGIFDLTIGTGFNGPVTLSASNLPGGATVDFETNPVIPGSTITVTFNNLTSNGNFNISLQGTDGNETAIAMLNLQVVGTPGTPVLNAPANGAVDVNLSTLLQWTPLASATGYVMTLSTNPDLSNPVLVFPALNPSVATGLLMYNTTYYWQVVGENDCGTGNASPIFSFTTSPDITVATGQPTLNSCLADQTTATFTLGEGFGDQLSVSVNANPAADFSGFTSSFAAGSRVLSLVWNNFLGIAPGTYVLSVTITGEGYSNVGQVTVNVETAPTLSALQVPANTAEVPGGTPVDFSWTAVAGADNYQIEIATDDTFTDVLVNETVNGTTYATSLAIGQYYWRVAAVNDCGESLSGFFVFTVVESNAVLELAGTRLEIWPNPTTGPVQISLSAELNDDLFVDVISVQGQQLRHVRLSALSGRYQLDLSDLPAGAYLLRLQSGKAQTTARIMVQ
ncbi:proprotein convertase P-domain-containing protein [Lewinella sp. LCG006]|uniref:proprotein convertase P-domain-containing protein n=1 Tax=Lewinella sp. LCG006 TaxID=3231911 RepID=UPI0034615596